jgi:hypothetical protein
MINIKTAIASVAFGTMVLCAIDGPTYAGSITQPGETIGYALGAPLPEGVYFANTLSDGGFRGVDDHRSDLLVNIPVLAWSTSECCSIVGGKLWGYVATPYVSFGDPLLPGGVATNLAGRDFMAIYNPFAGVGLAWDLGNGWGFSNIVGGYGPVDNELRFFGHNVWVFNDRPALSYTGDDHVTPGKWNLTVSAIYGLTSDDVDARNHPKVSPDYINVDVTALKTIDKWTAGFVGYGSSDLSCTNVFPCAKQSQIALGAYIGYDFTGITTGLYVTSDVYSNNYFNLDGTKSYETRVWTRVIVPLWTAPKMESMK